MAAKTSIESGEKLQESTRERILAAALDLVNTSGRDALTTRAVAGAAGVQPPVIYRHFLDKEGLLEGLAEHGFARYLARKQQRRTQRDPVEALRRGWDEHVQFGLQHPMLYLLMYAEPRDAVLSGAAGLAFGCKGSHGLANDARSVAFRNHPISGRSVSGVTKPKRRCYASRCAGPGCLFSEAERALLAERLSRIIKQENAGA